MSAPGQSSQVVDPLEYVDFSEYDGLSYQSPSLSPAATKPQFPQASTATATPSIMPSSSSQPLSGPSHQYDQYKQQTPFVPGALATTMAVNQSTMTGYNLYSMSPNEDLFDFNAAGSQNSHEMDMDFDSSDAFFFDSTINPSAIGPDSQLPSPPAVTSNIGRMYPGMHQQQAALAKAQAQQRQQQQIIQQQQAQRQQQQQQPKHQRSKSAQPSDPIVEQKITQLLNSMRAKPSPTDLQNNQPMLNIPRLRKEEDDMDEDERLLASEEGKKLSSKERRQLRNKVSARAFRSRRKEYISQLEAEIANKVTENGDLRAQNRALIDENRRLSDLTRMLLSSPSFSNFLDHLSTNPSAMPQQQQQAEHRQSEARQMPKDVNPYAAAHQVQQQQLGMTIIPEQTGDFFNLETAAEAFNYQQPSVFAVLETPELPEIDTALLSGKSNIVDDLFESDDSKIEIPMLEAPALLEDAKSQAPESPVEATSSSKTVADLDGDLYDEVSTVSSAQAEMSTDDLSATIESKTSIKHHLVCASSDEAQSTKAWRRVQHIYANMESSMARLERLTADL